MTNDLREAWTPEQFWQYVAGYTGQFEADAIRDMMRDRGLALSQPSPAGREAIERIIMRRFREKRIDGYTKEMADEIASTFSPHKCGADGDGVSARLTLECARQAIEYSIDMGCSDPGGVLLQTLNRLDAALATPPAPGAERAAVIEECAKAADEAVALAAKHYGAAESVGAHIAAARIRGLAVSRAERSAASEGK